jgi:homospermidine synthase
MTVAVVVGVCWVIENHCRGLVESDDIDYDQVPKITDPYTSPNVNVPADWNAAGLAF